MNVPTRKSTPDEVNAFNLYIRQQPWYEAWFRQQGLDPNKVKLSRGQQSQLEQLLAQQGVPVADGMHIDQAGNLNQKNRLGRNIAIGAAMTGATLATMGAAGAGPMAGWLGGGGTVAGGGGAAAAASPLGGYGATAIPAAVTGTTAATSAAVPAAAAAVAPAVTKAAGRIPWGRVLDYGLPAAERVVGGIVANQRGKREAELEQNSQALDESKLDPFRGYMMQSRDASRLDWMANQEFDPPTVNVHPKYGANRPPAPRRSYTGSPELRMALLAARDRILEGDTGEPITPGARPLPVLRRPRRAVPADNWLEA